MKHLLVLSMVTLSILAILSQPGYAAEDAAAAQTIKEISATWKTVSAKGFEDAAQAKRIMENLPNDQAALVALEKAPGDHAALVTDAKQNLAAFQAYINKKKAELIADLQRRTKASMMIAQKWDTVSKQALAAGSNVQAGMVQMYKQSTQVADLRKKSDLLMAIAGSDDTAAKQLAQQVDFIESVGVRLGAVDNAVTPRDVYAGADKADLKAKIESAWKAARPQDEILGIRFIDEAWSRKTEKRYNNTLGWYLLDFSSLEVKVVVKEDEHMAAIYPVYLTKDHLKSDALEIDVETASTTPFVKSKMLLKDYKP